MEKDEGQGVTILPIIGDKKRRIHVRVFDLFDDTPFGFRKYHTPSTWTIRGGMLDLKLNPSLYDMPDLVIGMRNPKRPRREQE